MAKGKEINGKRGEKMKEQTAQARIPGRILETKKELKREERMEGLFLHMGKVQVERP